MRLPKILMALPLMLISLSACSTELFDQSYSPYPSEFDPGNGVVTIFRESHFVGSGVIAFVNVGQRPFGDIHDGSGIKIGLSPGHEVIEIHSALAQENLSIPIEIEAGKNYYIEIAAQPNPIYTEGALGYLLGSLKSDVHQYCGSGWCAAVEDAAIAQPKLKNITLGERVRRSEF